MSSNEPVSEASAARGESPALPRMQPEFHHALPASASGHRAAAIDPHDGFDTGWKARTVRDVAHERSVRRKLLMLGRALRPQ
jgi:hypothetical protein